MRTLEFMISLTLAIHILWPIFTGKENPRLVNLLPVLTVPLVGVHLIYEGFRWQMIPLYALTGIFLITALPELRHPSTEKYERLSWSTVGLIGIFMILVSSVVLLVLMPIPRLPTPTGKYAVGTQTFILVDESRPELYSEEDEPRKFLIRVWYPANPESDEQYAPLIDIAPVFLPAIASSFGLPKFFFNHFALSNSLAWQDAPVERSSNGYPIILFSHGLNGFASENSVQAMELASRGNVVVALQHTYGAVVTVFPDGKIVYNDPSILPNNVSEQEYTDAAQKLVNQWSNDIVFALDYMSNKNQDPADQFYLNLDFSRVGVYGHSFGGAGAIQFCSIDKRCKAVLAIDPSMTPISEQILENGLSKPAFFMFSQEWIDEKGSQNNRLFKKFYENTDPASHVIEIQGTTDNDFSDLPMLFPFAHQLGLTGSIDGGQVNKIINLYMSIFFIQSLNEYSSDLFPELSTYPEVINLDYLREIIHPTHLTLPGGQIFTLGKGEVRNGKWVPLRAEWLVGTEISRWVALPWSPELETIIKTLKIGDQIELTMTNSDTLVFNVNSIQKINMGELLTSKVTKLSLLVVLYNYKDANSTFWVVTALP